MIPAFMLGVWSAILFALACFVAARLSGQLRSVPARPVAVPLMIEEEAMTQLSLIEAMEAKDEILADVAENHEGWMTLAVEKFHAVRHQLPDEFLGEDIRRVLTDNGLPQPKAPHVWGAFVGYIAKKKHIVHTGVWRPMKAAGSNGRRSPAYALAARRELEPA